MTCSSSSEAAWLANTISPCSDNAVRYLDIIEERVDVLRQLTEELFGYSAAVSAVGEDGREILKHLKR